MNENMGAFIFSLIQSVVFLIPIIVLFYKFGRRDQILDEAVRDMDGIGVKIANIKDNYNSTLGELKAQIENVNKTLIKVDTWLDIMKQSIEELKKDERRHTG